MSPLDINFLNHLVQLFLELSLTTVRTAKSPWFAVRKNTYFVCPRGYRMGSRVSHCLDTRSDNHHSGNGWVLQRATIAVALIEKTGGKFAGDPLV